MRKVQIKKIPSAPRLLIRESVLSKIGAFRQMSAEPESGGILLGEYFPIENVIRILFASKPGTADRRSLFSFHRDANRSTRIARLLWRQSGGRIHYVGEWHTHPESVPKPSCADRLSMARLLRRSTVVTGGLVLLILGRNGDYIGFHTVAGSSKTSLELDQGG